MQSGDDTKRSALCQVYATCNLQHATCNTLHAAQVVDTLPQRRSLCSLKSLACLKHVCATWAQRLPCHLRTTALLGSLPTAFCRCRCRCHCCWLLAAGCSLLDCQEFPRTLIATSQHWLLSKNDKGIPFSVCSFITPFVRCCTNEGAHNTLSIDCAALQKAFQSTIYRTAPKKRSTR